VQPLCDVARSRSLVLVSQGQFVVWFVNVVIVVEVIDEFFHWNALGWLHFALFETVILLIEAAHFLAAFSDPGSVQMNTVWSSLCPFSLSFARVCTCCLAFCSALPLRATFVVGCGRLLPRKWKRTS
jgi:hypothetical protein